MASQGNKKLCKFHRERKPSLGDAKLNNRIIDFKESKCSVIEQISQEISYNEKENISHFENLLALDLIVKFKSLNKPNVKFRKRPF